MHMYVDLDGSGQDVAVVRQARGERRSVVEGVARPVPGLLQTGLEGLQFLPQPQDLLFLRREVHSLGGRTHHDCYYSYYTAQRQP